MKTFLEMVKLVPKILNVGMTMEYTTNLTENFLSGFELGLYCIAIHLGSLRSFFRKRVDIEDLLRAMQLTTRFPISVFSRLPYTYNLCGSTTFLAWNGNHDQDLKMKDLLKEIEYELHTLAKLGGSVVTSCGWFRDQENGKQAASKTIDNINFKLGEYLLLENDVKKNHAVATTLEDIDDIVGMLHFSTKMFVGLCLNLPNFHESEHYDFTTENGVEQLIIDYETMFEDQPPNLIVLGEVKNGMWSQNVPGLTRLIRYSHKHNLPLLVSTQDDVRFLQSFTEILFSINET